MVLKPLFEIDGRCPIPRFPIADTGEAIKPDGVRYFTAAETVEKTGLAEANLVAMWQSAISQFVPGIEAETAEAATTAVPEEEAPLVPPLDAEPSTVPAGFVARLAGFKAAKHPHIPEDLWRVFVDQCWARKLDPLLNQIYPHINEDSEGRYTIETVIGIDGMRLLARRSKEYTGCDEPRIEWDTDGKPWKVSMTVYRDVAGERCAFVGTAIWSEYGGRESEIAQAYPATTLERVAESKALKKAFPQECGHLFIPDEIKKSAPRPKVQIREEDIPGSRQQLEIEMAGFAIREPKQRDKIIADFRKRYGNKYRDEQLWAIIYRAVATNPEAFGGVRPAE